MRSKMKDGLALSRQAARSAPNQHYFVRSFAQSLTIHSRYEITRHSCCHNLDLFFNRDFCRYLGRTAWVEGPQLFLSWREKAAVVYAGRFQRVGHVRYFRDDVAGVCVVHLRLEKHLDAVGLADL